MERESFEDEEVARLLNRDFIAIKVDREERPDIDSIYMGACQAVTGQGGWPLSIFMTSDKKPFFAATYIPKDNRYQRLGMLSLLPRIAELWKNERAQVQESSHRLSELLMRDDHNSGQSLDEDIFAKARQHLGRAFDREWGGFSPAPKFPSPHHGLFLMRYYYYYQDEEALEMAEKTLELMYKGGIYDHIGGGFARYSTDRQWLVPHFEKMLYDNALLSLAYLEAYQISGKDIYARVAREIFTYILRDMTSPQGAFYSAQDADSEGVEGKFYVWSSDEVKEVLGEVEGDYFCRCYGISQEGNFGGENIPNLLAGLPGPEELPRLEGLRERLWQEREKRIHPHLDDKILTAWNGLMIAALATGARILDEPRYLEAASRAAAFIQDKMRRPDGRLLARYREGEALYLAYALDYAAIIWGLLELYQASFETGYLYTAWELNRDLLRLFGDDENGGLFLYGSDAEQLLTRPKEAYDGALPSDNSIAALNFARLGKMLGEQDMEDKAAASLHAFAADINRYPSGHTFFLLAALYQQKGQKQIIVAGKKEAVAALKRRYLPDTDILCKDPADDRIDALAPFVKDTVP